MSTSAHVGASVISASEASPDPRRTGSRRVAVIGGGISGLAAAKYLIAAGADVTVFDADARLGGQLHAVEVAGHQVDVGAESMFTAAPGPLALVDELGLGDRLVAANAGTTWIWGDRGLRRLPQGFTPAGPTRLWPMLSARVLSLRGMIRAAGEALVPTTDTTQDVAVGDYLERRFGREVVDGLVDPLLGGLHAGDVRRLSLRSATPQLAALTSQHRSLLLRRRPRPGAGPAFVTLTGGMHTLVARLAERLRQDGVDLQVGTAIERLERDGRRTRLHTDAGPAGSFDAVVLAVPAAVAARLTGTASPAAAEVLRQLRTASVAVAALAYPRSAAATSTLATGTGLLVPSHRGRLLKAATHLSTKWPHHADGDHVYVRASAGRVDDTRAWELDDATLADRLHADLAAATGLDVEPAAARVHRWAATMPQLEVGHADRLAAVERALAQDLPDVALAGAPYHGPGIAACLRSAATAASDLVTATQER